ncbi:MAG: hypothetical protein U0S36_05775 [Candidatus Nanopelagicales bacterium]
MGLARAAAATSLLAVLACTACSGGSAVEAVASPTSAPTSASPSPVPVATSSSASPSPTASFDRTATPATTSGTLSKGSLPPARVLGPGWSLRVDPGTTEDGYVGNGTPAVARDPGDTVAALRPIGCAEEAVYAEELPVPAHALEVDYRHRATKANGVGLALEFRDAATAQRFFDVYTRSLALCRSGEGGTTRVRAGAAPGTGAVATVTTDPVEATTWRELAEVGGRYVRLLAVEGTRAPLRPWPQVLEDLRRR